MPKSITRISSSSGTRPTISRIARRTIGPMVSSSSSVGSTSDTVAPCFSLSWTSRRRSENSAWWKFNSPNQRSTRAGTARASSAARSAAARLSAFEARVSKVVRPMASRVLTTTTDGFARAATASGSAPKRYESAPSPPGTADAPITTRSAFSASRRIALRTFGASRRTASPLPLRCCLMNAASARSAWARTAMVMPAGTRWRTTTVAPWNVAIASAKRMASSACGPPRTGTRTRLISREPRCFTTAMSHGDSRTTSSIVGENTVGPPLWPSLPAGALPPQPKMMRSDSCSADASMMPSAACRPMRTIGWIVVPGGP